MCGSLPVNSKYHDNCSTQLPESQAILKIICQFHLKAGRKFKAKGARTRQFKLLLNSNKTAIKGKIGNKIIKLRDTIKS